MIAEEQPSNGLHNVHFKQIALIRDPEGLMLALFGAKNGYWELPGGNIEQKDVNAATKKNFGSQQLHEASLRRHIFYQTGLVTESITPLLMQSLSQQGGFANFLSVNLALIDEYAPKINHSNEFSKSSWVSIAEARRLVFDDRELVSAALDELEALDGKKNQARRPLYSLPVNQYRQASL